MMDQSNFRHWCQEMWYLHQDEIEAWTGKLPGYDSTYYFRKHRWMLKNLWKQGLTKRTVDGTIVNVVKNNVH